MKSLTKILSLATATSCLMFGATTMADTSKTSINPITQAGHNKLISMLFTIEANHATLTHLKGNTYQLTIPLTEIKTVLAFSDRPNRIAFKMKPSHYAEMIHTGKDSFNKVAPNMALSWANKNNQPAEAFTVSSYTKDNNQITYTLKLMTNEAALKNQSGKVSLFIDAATTPQPNTNQPIVSNNGTITRTQTTKLNATFTSTTVTI